MNDLLNEVFQQSESIYSIYDAGKVDEAKALTLAIESKQAIFTDEFDKAVCRKYAAGFLIDIGSDLHDEDMVKRGTQYFLDWIDHYAPENELAHELYNLANGYFCSWKLHGNRHLSDAIDTESHRLARHYYRQAIKRLQPHHYSDGLACQLWTNYGNALDSIGRSVEAIDAYDVALRINPNMGMALGNKAIALSYLALLMSGYTHLFFLEAIRLLKKALEQPLAIDAKLGFTRNLEQLNNFLEQHGEMKPESVKGIEPTTDFHRFLCTFCARHGLYLNPVTFLGDEGGAFYGDPLFISTMYAKLTDKNKFDRYTTFLNEIKQDYVLGRYLLVQSQCLSSDIDTVDEGVQLFYPLDHSLHGAYLQLLKAAKKQAIAVLDKVAYFIYDYCKLTTPSADRITFRQIFGGNDKIRGDFNNFASPHLFALFSLTHDISKKGDWNLIYEHRDALTHRFLVVHDFQATNPPNADIPRVDIDTFINNTILAFKIARAAVMYLILFVENQEQIEAQKSRGQITQVPGTPLDNIFRYRPR